MSGPSPFTRCKRPSCRLEYREHADGRCADGRRFRMGNLRATGASQSFSDDEIECLDAIMRGLLGGAGADLKAFARARSKTIGQLMRKAKTMRARSESNRALREERAAQMRTATGKALENEATHVAVDGSPATVGVRWSADTLKRLGLNGGGW